jgi:hypothetical protein
MFPPSVMDVPPSNPEKPRSPPYGAFPLSARNRDLTTLAHDPGEGCPQEQNLNIARINQLVQCQKAPGLLARIRLKNAEHIPRGDGSAV